MKDEWISVTDRLPEVSGKYKVLTERLIMGTDLYSIKKGWTYDRTMSKVDHISRWAPLPSPPNQGHT
jgi:hypothetical protein